MGRPRKKENDKTVDIKLTIPKQLRDIGRERNINFSEVLKEALNDKFSEKKKSLDF